ncbi:hypothetical protein KC19_4G009500 [Ceratodon purpureus]|uniref:Uncharacterized protein n=1 Tax=Ceratodon purpureus TaxID=3225 RepID=A0A8T0I420_CERPU|nr:hypothetical protein KC19_4G009500 [Ceratodon purpureus]
MLAIEVELPHETKTIEWKKAHPTFHELKIRLQQCGIATNKNCCIEVEKAQEFLTPDDDDLLDGPLIRVRAYQIICNTPWKRPRLDEPPKKDRPNVGKMPKTYHNRYEELFEEEVIPFVGRIFVLPKKFDDISLQDCIGTVGLVGPKGESVGAFHLVQKAWKHPRRYDVYIKYMNHDKQPCFPAKVVTYNDELDIFVATPLPPFEFNFPKFLQLASGIAVGDSVHCVGFPNLVNETILSQKEKFAGNNVFEQCVKDSDLGFPSVFTGNVCFPGWKQVLADYRSFSNSSGAIIVDNNGHLKGIHMSSLRAAEYVPELSELEPNCKTSDKTKALYEQVNKCSLQLMLQVKCNTEAAVFVPINILMKIINPAVNPTSRAILYS